jgi:hypothetical protein
MSKSIAQYYRCPDRWLRFSEDCALLPESEFSRCSDPISYCRTSGGHSNCSPIGNLTDALQYSVISNGIVHLPFEIDRVMEALRCEEYVVDRAASRSAFDSVVTSLYYSVRPFMPVSVRKHLQRIRLNDRHRIAFPSWPVDVSVDKLAQRFLLLFLRASGLQRIPFIWFWPDGAPSCAIMTHDVETEQGREFCSTLMDINDSFAVKSSFQVVPEVRYEVTPEYLNSIRSRGYEVNVQDLNHDGRLYRDRKLFVERAKKINSYGAAWGALGFRAAVLYRNERWFDQLRFEYEMSVPNVGHLEPQRGGCCTVMPYFIGNILELPVTTTQDYSLFHIIREYSLDLWKRQVGMIMESHGLASFIVHPDYVIRARERKVYEDLLSYLCGLKDSKGVWLPTPGEVNRWWRQRAKMRLVEEDGKWRVKGEGYDRARVAYASEHNGELEFDIESAPCSRAVSEAH